MGIKRAKTTILLSLSLIPISQTTWADEIVWTETPHVINKPSVFPGRTVTALNLTGESIGLPGVETPDDIFPTLEVTNYGAAQYAKAHVHAGLTEDLTAVTVTTETTLNWQFDFEPIYPFQNIWLNANAYLLGRFKAVPNEGESAPVDKIISVEIDGGYISYSLMMTDGNTTWYLNPGKNDVTIEFDKEYTLEGTLSTISTNKTDTQGETSSKATMNILIANTSPKEIEISKETGSVTTVTVEEDSSGGAAGGGATGLFTMLLGLIWGTRARRIKA